MGIPRQVHQYLPYPADVSVNPVRSAPIFMYDQLKFLLLCFHFEKVTHFLQELLNAERRFVQFQLSGIDPGKVKDFIDDAGQVFTGLLDVP